MGKTNFDEIDLSGKLSAAGVEVIGDVEYSGEVLYTGDFDISGSLEVGTDITAGGGITATGKVACGSAQVGADLEVTGDLTLTGNTKIEGVLDELFAVATADATDEETAVTLVNELKTAYNSLITYLRTGIAPSDE